MHIVEWGLESRFPQELPVSQSQALGSSIHNGPAAHRSLQHPLLCSEPGKSGPHPVSGYSSFFCIPRVLWQAHHVPLQAWTPEPSSALFLLWPGQSLQPLRVPSPAGFLPAPLLSLSTSLLLSLSLCFSLVFSWRPRDSGGWVPPPCLFPLFVLVSCPSFFFLV